MGSLLALETATDTCSVAVWQDGAVSVVLSLHRPRQHAEQLVPLVQDALRYSGLALRELNGIAVSMGPGSFTGLRIGVSTAKGLAHAAGVPLVGVPTLEALAAAASGLVPEGALLGTALHARKDEVFWATYRLGADGPETVHPPSASAVAEAAAALGDTEEVWLLGSGARALAAHLPRAHRLGGPVGLSARWVAQRGAQRLAQGMTEDVATFEPAYLKPFVARKPKQTIFDRIPF